MAEATTDRSRVFLTTWSDRCKALKTLGPSVALWFGYANMKDLWYKYADDAQLYTKLQEFPAEYSSYRMIHTERAVVKHRLLNHYTPLGLTDKFGLETRIIPAMFMFRAAELVSPVKRTNMVATAMRWMAKNRQAQPETPLASCFNSFIPSYYRARGPSFEFDPQWRTSTAIALAQQIFDTEDSSIFPYLADALQDAGCEWESLLTPMRQTPDTLDIADWTIRSLLVPPQ